MHQPDPAADLAARKMAHPADLPRRGSGASGNPAAVTLTGVPGMGSHALSSEDYQSLQMQSQLASSALHPPQTLNLMSQPLVQSGAQIKKKSGFQITSVTPAQISANMSSNNSIAEDTESYDDLDESHTEDLSSSEILDVSLSRATDLGGPERSSSEETLNNFQEAETPGAVSPNQPHLPQHPLPPNVQQSIMINGNVHHHHHHLHHHGHHPPPHAGLPAVPFPGGPFQNTGSVKPAATGNSESPVTAASVSTVPSAAVPAVGPASQVIRKASGPVSAGIIPTTGGSTISGVSTMLPGGINVNPSGATCASSVNAMSGNLNTNILGASSNGSGASASINLSGAAVGPAAGQQPAVPFTATSRFRVVKLDSSTEPFKKGRWTCMEFYDKENAVPSEAAAAINKAVESIKQNPLEVTSERESTSGSSVSSNISTLSHYTDSVGSGEMGTSTTMQQPGFQGLGPPQMDFSNTVAQNVPAPNIPQSISQSQLAQLQMHPQDASYSPQKQVGASAQTMNAATGVQPAPVNILGVQSSLGHPQPPVSTMVPQQLPYPPQAQPISSLPTVQQQLQYAHQQSAPAQMASGHVMPVNQTSVPGNIPEYLQHPQILQTAVTPVQPSSTGGGNPATVPVVQAQVMQAPIQSSSAQAPPAVAPVQPVALAQASMPATGGQVLGVGPQVNIPSAVPQAATSQQSSSTGLQQGVPIPSQQVLPPSQGIQLGAPGHPQQVIIAPQNTLLPPKPLTQLIEPAVPGMASQQVPVVSPLHAASGVPPVQQLSTSIPSGMPPTLTTLGPLPTVAQPLPTLNGSLVQNINQAPVLQSVPVAQNMPLPMAPGTGQYVAPSLIQSVPSQMEETQRLDHTVTGVPHVGEGIALDVSGAGSLLPLKSLPLSTALVDGEDER